MDRSDENSEAILIFPRRSDLLGSRKGVRLPPVAMDPDLLLAFDAMRRMGERLLGIWEPSVDFERLGSRRVGLGPPVVVRLVVPPPPRPAAGDRVIPLRKGPSPALA